VTDSCRTVEGLSGEYVPGLPPMTPLIVKTKNSLYRLVTAGGLHVFVQGGAYFPAITLAYVEGASLGGSLLRVGWICVGAPLELWSGGQRILTSPVCAIEVEYVNATLH